VSFLANTEFAYNDNVNIIIGETPFKICLRFQPAFPMNIAGDTQVREKENPVTRKAVKDL
jgi:hypothetical protein